MDAAGDGAVTDAGVGNIERGGGHYVGVTVLTEQRAGTERFEDVVLPHLDAAYRLARWLTRNEHDAEDVVQESSLRALRYFRTYAGRNGRAWFFRIVRNTCASWRVQAVKVSTDVFDEAHHSEAQIGSDPETLLLHAADASFVEGVLRDLPGRFRELLVLRELEGLSYQELADVLEIPIGSVMSGLSRARRALRTALEERSRSGLRNQKVDARL